MHVFKTFISTSYIEFNITESIIQSEQIYIYKSFFQYFELRYKGKAVRLVAATIGHLHYVSTYVHCPNELEIKYMF